MICTEVEGPAMKNFEMTSEVSMKQEHAEPYC